MVTTEEKKNADLAYNALWWLHKKADLLGSEVTEDNPVPEECVRQYHNGNFVPKEREFQILDLVALPQSDTNEDILYILNQGYKWRSGIDSLVEEIKKLNPQKIIMINDDHHTRLVGMQQGGGEWISNEATIFQDIVERTGITNYLVLDCEYGAQRYYFGSCVDEDKVKYFDHFTQTWEWRNIEELYLIKKGEVVLEDDDKPMYEEVPYEKIKYKICCVNKRPELHRHLSAMHLAGNRDVFLTNYTKWKLDDIIRGDYDREWSQFRDDLLWNKLSRMYQKRLEKRKNVLEQIDTTWDAKHYLDISASRQKLTTQKHAEAFVSLIPETLWHKDTQFWSEKTKKAIVTKRPFLLLAPAGTLQLLKDLGFKTFERFWDESYDNIKDQGKRYEAVMKIVDQILAMTYEECVSLLSEMHPILKHNYYHAIKIRGQIIPHPPVPQSFKKQIIEKRADLELLKERAIKRVDSRKEITIFGDSWSKTWPSLLPDNFLRKNLALNGNNNNNDKIFNDAKEFLHSKETSNFLIVSWSRVDDYDKWKYYITEINRLCAENHILPMHYTVFGETPNWDCDNFHGAFVHMIDPELLDSNGYPTESGHNKLSSVILEHLYDNMF